LLFVRGVVLFGGESKRRWSEFTESESEEVSP